MCKWFHLYLGGLLGDLWAPTEHAWQLHHGTTWAPSGVSGSDLTPASDFWSGGFRSLR